MKRTLLCAALLLVPAVCGANVDPTALPVGDNKYSETPKRGYIMACNPDRDFSGTIGARGTGSWIHGSTWDATQKIVVRGEVYWPNAAFAITTTTDSRILSGNKLPVDIPTGTFPTAKDDPAYKIDSNPNTITEQPLSLEVPLMPLVAEKPSCVSIAIVGVATDGVPIYSALDVQGRDAVAHEVQDACAGHPQPSGEYHYHSLSPCIPSVHENNALVGYALDGFGIFSPYDTQGRELASTDLDECHGTTTPVMWDGREVTMYHYVLTRDYPYTIGCFRGAPAYIQMPPPPTPRIVELIGSVLKGLISAFASFFVL